MKSVSKLQITSYIDFSLLCYIYALPGTRLIKQDIKKFNEQYSVLDLKTTRAFHDRFLLIDEAFGYHIGASIKDAGKKCFA